MRSGPPSTPSGVLGYFAAAGLAVPPFESPTDFLLDLVNTRDADDEGAAAAAAADAMAAT